MGRNSLNWGIIITIGVLCVLCLLCIFRSNFVPVKEKNFDMKVNFYKIDRAKADKGEFVGSAGVKKGKLIVDVSDEALKKILSSPYVAMEGQIEEGIASDRLVTYEPGTIRHLRAIAIDCWRFGYIGEIVQNK